MRRLVAVVGFSACFVSTFEAAAQSPTDRFWATVHAKEARRLLVVGKVGEACAKFEESHRRVPDAGTLLELAKCQERDGKTATAHATLLQARELAAKDPSKFRSAQRRKAADRHLRSLEPKLSTLTVTFAAPEDARSAEVKRDGTVVVSEQVGVAVPVDPGEHEITVSAPGKKPWSEKVTVGAKRDKQVVTVPVLEPDQPEPATPAPPKAAAAAPKRPIASAAAAASTAPAKADTSDPIMGIYLRSGFGAYFSDARTIGGLGGGIGVRVPLGDWFQVQTDVSYLFMIANTVEVRAGVGVHRPGFYTPAAKLLVSLFAGGGLRFLTEERPTLVTGPAVAAGLHLAPLRFSNGNAHASVFEVGFGVGTDLPGLGLLYEATLLEVGTSF